MFYSIEEVIDDICKFEQVIIEPKTNLNILTDMKDIDFVHLYSEHYDKPMDGEKTVNDLLKRVEEYVNTNSNMFPKKRDKDIDYSTTYTVYKFWNRNSFKDIELIYLGTANSDEEVLKFFYSEQSGMDLCVYNSKISNVYYFERNRS